MQDRCPLCIRRRDIRDNDIDKGGDDIRVTTMYNHGEASFPWLRIVVNRAAFPNRWRKNHKTGLENTKIYRLPPQRARKLGDAFH